MALNAEAREELQDYVRQGRIGALFLRANLQVSQLAPLVGSLVDVEWRVSGFRAQPQVTLRANGALLGEQVAGRTRVRVADHPLELTLEANGRLMRSVTLRPQVRIPELRQLRVPAQVFHDEPCICTWGEGHQVERLTFTLTSSQGEALRREIDVANRRLDFGVLPVGDYRLEVLIQSADAEHSQRANVRLVRNLVVAERPPQIALRLDCPEIELGQEVMLHWQVAGAVALTLVVDGVEQHLLHEYQGALRLHPHQCGRQQWCIQARAAGGALSEQSVLLTVRAPAVSLDVDWLEMADERGCALRYRARYARKIVLELPQREGQRMEVPLTGRIELAAYSPEDFVFHLEAMDGVVQKHRLSLSLPPLEPEPMLTELWSSPDGLLI